MLNDLQIHAIEDSWQMVVPIADRVAERFYARLFAAAPDLRGLFAHAEMDAQGKRLIGALNLIVRSVDALETILPALEALGAKHVRYGVEEEHYALVGAVLLDTLAEALDAQFTPEARAGWAGAINVVSGAMIEAGRRRAVAA